MTTIDEEMFMRWVAQAVAQTMAAQSQASTSAAPSGGQKTSREGDVHKFFTRVDKLERAEQWREWHYQFRVATKAYSGEMGVLLSTVEKLDIQEVDSPKLEAKLNRDEADGMNEHSGALYSVLSLLTKGEANQVVRSVADTNGYVAWKKLCDRFNPRTPASVTATW